MSEIDKYAVDIEKEKQIIEDAKKEDSLEQILKAVNSGRLVRDSSPLVAVTANILVDGEKLGFVQTIEVTDEKELYSIAVNKIAIKRFLFPKLDPIDQIIKDGSKIEIEYTCGGTVFARHKTSEVFVKSVSKKMKADYNYLLETIEFVCKDLEFTANNK